jgi:serine phosphatase RsbU (regulator of sigma subunit)/anti-sigma regulatory factor (Ser/Thr protein kinase)
MRRVRAEPYDGAVGKPPSQLAPEGNGKGRHQHASLQLVADAALAHLTEDDLLDELMARVATIMAVDTVAILLLDEEEHRLRARAARGIEEEVEQGVTIPLGRGFAGRVAAERRPIRIPDVDHADIYNPILREKRIRSLMGVPLLVEGRVIGVMHVGSLTPREFTDDERDLLQLAADRAALAIEHAHLFAQERAAREAAERASAQLTALQSVTDAALAYLTEDELLEELLGRVAGLMSVDTVAILLLEGEILHARAARGIEEEVEQGVRLPLGRGFAGRIAAERRPIRVPDVDHADILNPILRKKGIRSLMGVPLLVEGRVIGVMHVGSLTPREFTDDERDLLQLAADRAALAIEQARLYEQERVAEALQRRLLPSRAPEPLGLEVASRYLPAAGGSLGGDWYDVFPLAGGAIGLAVGDVVGHGVEAAAVMAQLRTALRAYAVEGHAPDLVVERLNALMTQLGPAPMTTLAYLVLDPAEETLQLVNAGHPPPLVIDPSGEPHYLEPTGGVALGVTRELPYRVDAVPLPTGSIVMLYTDGLVEARGRSIDEGLERLKAAALRARPGDVDALCAAVVEHVVPEPRPDDVAFILARVPPLGDTLSTRWSASPDDLAHVRYLLRRWLRPRGAADDEIYDITVASQEACTNAVEHAYGPGRGGFRLDAELHEGVVRLTIRDGGRWRPPRGEHRGRGLALMRALMDEVDVVSEETGTAVVLTRRLRGSA